MDIEAQLFEPDVHGELTPLERNQNALLQSQVRTRFAISRAMYKLQRRWSMVDVVATFFQILFAAVVISGNALLDSERYALQLRWFTIVFAGVVVAVYNKYLLWLAPSARRDLYENGGDQYLDSASILQQRAFVSAVPLSVQDRARLIDAALEEMRVLNKTYVHIDGRAAPQTPAN